MAVEVEREIEKLVYNNKLSNAFLGVVDNDTPQFSYWILCFPEKWSMVAVPNDSGHCQVPDHCFWYSTQASITCSRVCNTFAGCSSEGLTACTPNGILVRCTLHHLRTQHGRWFCQMLEARDLLSETNEFVFRLSVPQRTLAWPNDFLQEFSSSFILQTLLSP